METTDSERQRFDAETAVPAHGDLKSEPEIQRPFLTLTEGELTELHELATKARRWPLAQTIAKQLGVLEEAVARLAHPKVASLAAARKRRDEGGK